jgi:uncharacterized protein involved in exopolysaccharide biosynthesis
MSPDREGSRSDYSVARLAGRANAPPPGGADRAPVLSTVVARLPLIIGITAAVAALGTVGLLLLPNKYTATVRLAPEERQSVLPGQLAGLAGLAGIQLGGQTQSPQFYASLLRSRPLVYAVLEQRYPTTRDLADSVLLLDVLHPRGSTLTERRWNASQKFNRATAASVDARTGIVSYAVTLTSPVLAAAVANAAAAQLNLFNAEARQSQAGIRRRFIEARVSEVADSLRRAEEAMRRFLAENRDFRNSPRLAFEHARLERAVMMQEELYTDLQRQLNASRIEEVDDVPVVTTVEPALPPERKSGPHRALLLASLVVFTAAAVTAILVLRDHGRELFPGLSAALRARSAPAPR